MELSWHDVPVKDLTREQLLVVIEDMYQVIAKATLTNKAALERIKQLQAEKPVIATVN